MSFSHVIHLLLPTSSFIHFIHSVHSVIWHDRVIQSLHSFTSSCHLIQPFPPFVSLSHSIQSSHSNTAFSHLHPVTASSHLSQSIHSVASLNHFFRLHQSGTSFIHFIHPRARVREISTDSLAFLHWLLGNGLGSSEFEISRLYLPLTRSLSATVTPADLPCANFTTRASGTTSGGFEMC